MATPESYVDDPNFTLKFVNKKSTERVMELVTKIRAAVQTHEVEVVSEPAKALAMIDSDPSLLLSSIQIMELQQDPNPPSFSSARLASLKPFLFPYYPVTCGSAPADEEFEMVRHRFLTDSRRQQTRLLWSFQDRLVRDLCATDDQFQRSSFQVATNQLAKDQTLPIHLVEKRKETLQSRLNALMRKSQKKTALVLENQKKTAKMIQDAKMFEVNYAKTQKSDPIPQDKKYELPVVCPFSFLVDGGYSKP